MVVVSDGVNGLRDEQVDMGEEEIDESGDDDEEEEGDEYQDVGLIVGHTQANDDEEDVGESEEDVDNDEVYLRASPSNRLQGDRNGDGSDQVAEEERESHRTSDLANGFQNELVNSDDEDESGGDEYEDDDLVIVDNDDMDVEDDEEEEEEVDNDEVDLGLPERNETSRNIEIAEIDGHDEDGGDSSNEDIEDEEEVDNDENVAETGESQGDFNYGNYIRGADDLHSVIQHFSDNTNLIVTTILGHNRGGNIVLLYASKYRVPNVVNISGRYDLKKGIRLGEGFMEKISQLGFIDAKEGKTEYRVTQESLMHRLNTDMHQACLEIDRECNVLTVHGSDDKVVPVEDAKEFEKIIPNHKLEVVTGANHGYTKHQNQLISIVIEFIKTSHCAKNN
ncbi:unnamed protein product [Cochlearia groenlandica]